jgi:hypothetical protein
MEKTRTPYYPISLKDKTLRRRFNKIGEDEEFRNADEKMEHLLAIKEENDKWLKAFQDKCEEYYHLECELKARDKELDDTLYELKLEIRKKDAKIEELEIRIVDLETKEMKK